MIGSSRNAATFLKAKNEEELQMLFFKYQSLTAKQYEIITIYPTKGGVVMWFKSKLEIGDSNATKIASGS